MKSNLQIGERVAVKQGSNISDEFLHAQTIRTEIERIQNFQRKATLLKKHMDGRRSALEVTYNEIVKDPSVLDDVTPIAREVTEGESYVLWEGYKVKSVSMFEAKRPDRGQLHRVVQHPNGFRTYCRYNSVTKDWIVCSSKDEDGNVIPNRFPPNVIRKAKSENWSDVGERTVARSVMNRAGDVTRREY